MSNDAPGCRRLGLLLWAAGMLGVVAFALLPLPALPGPAPIPAWGLRLLGVVQSGLLLAFAVWVGVRHAPRVGLAAPTFAALAERRPIGPALGPQLLPGIAGGVGGLLVLLAFAREQPAEIAPVARSFDPSLAVRVLYGGVTEEILLRWCVMTLLLFVASRRARRGGTPGRGAIALAILGSAVLFGVGHLPTVVAYGGTLDAGVVAYVVGANALFGTIAGLLFWRFGLEAAMLAHALAHVLFWIAR